MPSLSCTLINKSKMFSCEEEYNDAMGAAAEADLAAQFAKEIMEEVEELERQKAKIQSRIDELLKNLP
jgi:uncharacterized protein YceH (UPF0502 family)